MHHVSSQKAIFAFLFLHVSFTLLLQSQTRDYSILIIVCMLIDHLARESYPHLNLFNQHLPPQCFEFVWDMIFVLFPSIIS